MSSTPPRQTGKTSTLFALMDHLNQEGKYHCLYVNVEMAQSASFKSFYLTNTDQYVSYELGEISISENMIFH